MPWRWLQQAIALLRAKPRAMIGATSLLMAVALAPSVVQLALAAAAPGLAQLLSVAMAVLLYPPVVAGYFRLLHLLAEGGDAPPSAIFAVFNDGATVRRMILANLILVSGSLLLVTLLVSLLGGESLLQFMQALRPGMKQLPPLPPGMLPLLVVLLIVGAALATAQAFAQARIALSGRAPLPAIGDALLATARNFGVLLMFYVPISVFAFLAFMLVALVAVLVGGALGAIVPALAPVLASMVILVFALLLVLAMYALMFGFFYFAWRELFAGALPPPAPPTQHEIAA
jgi:hypothetical protein